MEMQCATNMMMRDARIRHLCSGSPPKSFAEKKRLFSAAAQALVSMMLGEKVEIDIDDIQLETETENCGAILIKERVSRNSEFQRMWVETTCLSELKTLAMLRG